MLEWRSHDYISFFMITFCKTASHGNMIDLSNSQEQSGARSSEDARFDMIMLH